MWIASGELTAKRAVGALCETWLPAHHGKHLLLMRRSSRHLNLGAGGATRACDERVRGRALHDEGRALASALGRGARHQQAANEALAKKRR